MKLNIFLSVVSIFTVFHLCRSSPLRHLQKRAAFYIANETACVVDNIVYTSGDPIPTDDPCEACRCRPPGFACVLKECKIKPGCRAVRHAGECCPEYICGCEHNGRFYNDGDEIKDPKNPCYQCYCQGSSIACAFVDCIYQDECDSVFVPGECCPKYINCTRDIPDRNLFLGGGNAFPPVNLLPVFNDESLLPEISSGEQTDQAVEQPENPTSSIKPEELNDTSEKVVTQENSNSEDELGKSETIEPESLVTEEKILNTEIAEKEAEPLESVEETKQDLPTENEEDKKANESDEETKTLLNSESDINKDDVEISPESENIKLTTEMEKELPQTTVGSKTEETEKEEVVTEKPLEIESPSTEVTQKDSQIKNSASENSKSLKLTDNDQLEENKKNEQNMKSDAKTTEETVTEQEQASVSTSVMPTVDVKESSTIQNRLPSEEIVVENSQKNSQATPLNINNAKIKSESAETVTIVVHVKESSKIPTETDFIAETVTPSPITRVSEENLLKSNDEINTEKDSSAIEDNKSTSKNFEIFPTTKQADEVELTSKLPSTIQNVEDIQEKSDAADNIAMEAEESSVSEVDPKVSDSNNGDDSLIITSTVDDIENNKEVRTDEEITEGIKEGSDELTSTVIKIDTSRPITIKIMTALTSSPKPEQTTTELENGKTEELTEEKETKNEKTEELTEEKETKNEKPEEIVEGTPELRSGAVEQEEKAEETTVQPKEESIKEQISTQTEKIESSAEKETEKIESSTEKETSLPKEKVKESTPTNIDDKPEIRTNDETQTEKTEDKTNTESIKENQTEESKPEVATESKNEGTEEPKQTTLSDN